MFNFSLSAHSQLSMNWWIWNSLHINIIYTVLCLIFFSGIKIVVCLCMDMEVGDKGWEWHLQFSAEYAVPWVMWLSFTLYFCRLLLIKYTFTCVCIHVDFCRFNTMWCIYFFYSLLFFGHYLVYLIECSLLCCMERLEFIL